MILLILLLGCARIVKHTPFEGNCKPYEMRCNKNSIEVCDGSAWIQMVDCNPQSCINGSKPICED